MRRATAVCYRCGVLCGVTGSGFQHTHYAKVDHMFPCRASFRLARNDVYPFELLEMELTPSQMKSNEQLDLAWLS